MKTVGLIITRYNIGAWSTSANMNTGRADLGGSGTQSLSISVGGSDGSNSVITELFDGTTWISESDYLIATRELSLTDRLATGGSHNTGITNQCFTWGGGSGSIWSTTSDMNQKRSTHASAGNNSNGLVFGGYSGGALVSTEEYDIGVWSGGGDLTTARSAISGGGNQLSAWATGGSGSLNTTEEYNGTSWSAGGNLLSGNFAMAGSGLVTAAFVTGGGALSSELDKTEEYDGTSWKAGGILNTARTKAAAGGSNTNGLVFGGYNSPSYLVSTEEYNYI